MSQKVTLAPEDISPPESAVSSQAVAVPAAVGLVALVASFFVGGHHFYASYLVAFLFALSIALGGLFFVLVQFATRAGWSVTVRRLAEQVMGTLPVFPILFLPIAFGLHDLYHWSHADAVAHDPILAGKAAYLNPTFFYIRAAFYLVVWAGLAWHFRRRSLEQDASGDPEITRRLQAHAAPGLVLYGVTVTFAAFDWIMSLDPHWYSTIFGVYFFAGCVVSICAVLILMILRLQGKGRMTNLVTWEHFHDLGKLLFAFVVFWAYIGFSQFMLIWYGNIPEETAWYLHRLEHGWKPVTLALAIGHFALPFLFLLSRDVKRHRLTLTLAAIWMLALHYLDLYWLVMPALGDHHFAPHLADLLALVGVGGIFVAGIRHRMRGQSLVPKGDPRLQEALSFENI